jgi:hypothetical protein
LHLGRLEQLEYLLAHRGARGQSFVYELVYDGAGKDGAAFLVGLIDAARLGHQYDGNLAGAAGENAAPTRGQSGPLAGDGRIGETASSSMQNGSLSRNGAPGSQKALSGVARETPSYAQAGTAS